MNSKTLLNCMSCTWIVCFFFLFVFLLLFLKKNYIFICKVVLCCEITFQDWTDYDEKAKESVGIYEVSHKFVKCWYRLTTELIFTHNLDPDNKLQRHFSLFNKKEIEGDFLFVFCFVFLIQYNIKIPNMASTICEKGRTNAHNSLKLTPLYW